MIVFMWNCLGLWAHQEQIQGMTEIKGGPSNIV